MPPPKKIEIKFDSIFQLYISRKQSKSYYKMPTEDNHITLMDGLARGLTVYKACVDINKQLFGEDGPDITFDNKDDMIDQAIDNYVNELWDFEIVSILYNYGLEKAIQSYKYESAVIDTIKGVVFHIIREHLPETDGYVNE